MHSAGSLRMGRPDAKRALNAQSRGGILDKGLRANSSATLVNNALEDEDDYDERSLPRQIRLVQDGKTLSAKNRRGAFNIVQVQG
jgi:hypothetical protein